MGSTTRAVNFSNFPRSVLTLYHHLLVRLQQHSASPNRLKVSKCRDENCDDFLPWLEKKAGAQVSSVLSIGKSDYGRSLFACKTIQAGDCLLKVPFTAQISPDNVLPEIKPLLADAVGTVAKLAVVILVEQKKGQSSEWAPYISRLPRHGELHSTIFWCENELEMIRQSSLYQETINQEAKIRKDYLAIKPAFDHFSEVFKAVKFEDFKHAYALVASRAWESMQGQSLIPFADFSNHDGLSESVVLCDEKEQVSEVIADRDYVPGEEVCVHVDIPYNDNLREMKLDLLQKCCLPKVKDANISSSGGSFVIKEVRSSRGKGKGIPQSLRAFSRVLCCTSAQELTDLAVEAVQGDGRLARRPLVKRSLEIRAHEILLSLIDELIQKYNMSISALHVLESTNCRKFAIRRQMALDLLTGEVRVLRSASAWLKNYCESYPEQAKPL
ncbi:uncharacterized protein LOC104886907 isoform X2 [Beta vulgaris subsp. vulgaris]|uniref:uncharacterized protein LOC104886907 isoform X2 n=1 Tax=Beta vulgaris subsp. vulgaris TaxID=3555 RepID=UPI00053FD229|nr:uncharacterized protein LOC104886907 isoform X2 [Beta vulgaris subsp. vulgaris]